jgi:23S rRNA pseudouridine1911/1915/1917 synthase
VTDPVPIDPGPTDPGPSDSNVDDSEETGWDAAIERLELPVEPGTAMRADAWIALQTGVSRTTAARWIEEGRVTAGYGLVDRPARKVHDLGTLIVTVPPPSPTEIVAQDLPLDIVYEDRWVVVVNKAAGMVMHPAVGHPDGTLVNALLWHCADIQGIGGEQRPGIVHRIDRDTSGLVVAAKNDEAHQHLTAQFAARTVRRRYEALAVTLRGTLPDAGTVETGHARAPDDRRRFTGQHGGRVAITNYTVTERFAQYALALQCRLQTGRTHQIRMHMSEAGSPLLGDTLYGGAAATNRLIARQALHAAELGFTLPDNSPLHFTVAPPEDFQSALDALRSGRSWR